MKLTRCSPWPQSRTKAQIAVAAGAAVALRTLRREIMGKLGYSLRELYRALEDPGDNHTRLDTTVRAGYSFPAKAVPLAALLELNLTLSAEEKVGKLITPPGLPLPEAYRAAFITEDRIIIETRA